LATKGEILLIPLAGIQAKGEGVVRSKNKVVVTKLVFL
jgi:hypothetical protein